MGEAMDENAAPEDVSLEASDADQAENEDLGDAHIHINHGT